MKLRKVFAFLVFAGMLMAACSPGGLNAVLPTTVPTDVPKAVETPTTVPTPFETENLPPAAVLIAQKALADQLGIATDQVKITTIEQVQWPNACLGAPNPDEACAEVLTDGFKAVFEAGGNTYEYHTNLDGSQVRLLENAAGGPVNPGPVIPDDALPGAVSSARQLLAQQLGAKLEDIKVVKFEQVEWPNGCLGVQMPGRMCTQVVTPGYRALFELDGKQYEFHTDETGGAVYPAIAPLPETANKVVVWEQTEGGVCSRVEIGAQNAAFGPCGGTMVDVPLQPGRAEELAYLVGTYSAFLEGTRAGTVRFEGQGQQEASAAEMRSIAEWAKLVNLEAQGGRGGASWGLAFAWHREGGIAGMCDDMSVYLTGWAMPTSCKAGQIKNANTYRLTAEELAQLYTWVDQYKNFEYERTDAATADAMTIRMVFSGTGQEEVTAQQQEQIAGFAAGLYANASQ